jgi:hypothetical protein
MDDIWVAWVLSNQLIDGLCIEILCMMQGFVLTTKSQGNMIGRGSKNCIEDRWMSFYCGKNDCSIAIRLVIDGNHCWRNVLTN